MRCWCAASAIASGRSWHSTTSRSPCRAAPSSCSGAERRRQVDAVRAGHAPLRQRQRRDPHSRPRRAPAPDGGPAAARRRVPEPQSRQRSERCCRTSSITPRCTASAGAQGRRRAMRGAGQGRARRPRRREGAGRFPAARRGASRSPARCCTIRPACCSTRRPSASTSPRARACSPSCARSSRRGRRRAVGHPSGRRGRAPTITSCCCTRGACSSPGRVPDLLEVAQAGQPARARSCASPRCTRAEAA